MDIQEQGTNQEHEAIYEARLWQAVIVSTIQEWTTGPLRVSQINPVSMFCFRISLKKWALMTKRS